MDSLLDRLGKSIVHLKVLDEIFATEDYPEKELYIYLREKLKELDSTNSDNKFSEELYVGGKKRNTAQNRGYGRQMILSDMIQYIINGRGYFYAIRNEENMRTYIKIILNMINQLMLYDSLTTNVGLRSIVLRRLESEIGDAFFKESDRLKEHNAMLLYNGPVGFPLNEVNIPLEVLQELSLNESDKEKALEILDSYYDSLLPKPLGLWGELLVYIYLLRQKIGYVFPLLLTQRLISGDVNKFLKPPDFLVLPFTPNQKLMGVEVGAGKDIQSGNFSTITGIPTSTKANADNPKRCTICGKWILFCPVAIERYSDLRYQIEDMTKSLKCVQECNLYSREEILEGKCPYAMHRGGDPEGFVMEMKGDKSKYHFHLRCLLKDRRGSQNLNESRIITYYPYVKGLEELEEMVKSTANTEERVAELERLLAEKEEEIRRLHESRSPDSN